MGTIHNFLEKEKIIRLFFCLAISIILCFLLGLFFGTITTFIIWIAKEVQIFFNEQTIDKNNYVSDTIGTLAGSVIYLLITLFF